MTTPSSLQAHVLSFGPFLLDLRRRMLTQDGQEVRLGGRAMDLLATLARRPGELIPREELVRQVWPTTFVEETSLRVHIYALRKALGDTPELTRYIANLPGRGYSFIAPVVTCDPDGPHSQGVGDHQAPLVSPRGNLPFHADAVIGQQNVIRDIGSTLESSSLVTVIGAGGMGKTRVAVAAGQSLQDRFPDGAWFVNLSSVADASALTATVAISLGVLVQGGNPWPRLETHLKGRRLLIVLDNCEHLAADVASLVSTMLAVQAGVRLLATSRIPLGIPGEVVIPLPPLGTTESTQLFLERARAATSDLSVESRSIDDIRAICMRLDGMPLAIELAAARAATLGLNRLIEGLDDVFALLAKGRRASSPRHRTLETMLDWSHDLLDEKERIVFRRLSVFRSDFTADAAAEIASSEHLGEDAVRRCVHSLVAKSLVSQVDSPSTASFRLLHITRAYAESKLEAAGEAAEYAQRHARHVCRLLHQAQLELLEVDEDGLEAWQERQSRILDDIRAAIDRSFAPQGDRIWGMRVCAAARHHILEFGLFSEFGPRIQRAMQLLQELTLDDPALELRLCTAWCSIGLMVGHRVSDTEAFAQRMFALMEQVPGLDDQIDGLYGLILWRLNTGEHMQALEYLGRLRRLLPSDSHPAWVFLGERMLAMTHHHLGDQDAARALMQKVLDNPTRKVHRIYVGLAPRQITASAYLIRIHWIQGRSDDASDLLDTSLRGNYANHTLGLGTLLGQGGLPLLLWQGRDAEARELLERLKRDVNRQEQQGFWRYYIGAFEHVLACRASDGGPHQVSMPAGNLLASDLFCTFVEGAVGPDALGRAERGEVGWCAPEILRAHAENLLHRDPTTPAAEPYLDRALALARCHNALAWELRIACSLARCWMRRNDHVRARSLLSATLGKVRQGLGTADVVRANELLATLVRATGRNVND